MNKARLLLPGLILGLAAASAANAQTVSIVSGNGQVICAKGFTGCGRTLSALVVKVVNASGAPLSGATVNWSYTPVVIESGGTITLGGSTSTTDSSGLASMSLAFYAPEVNVFSVAYQQATVTATYGASSVTFTETQSVSNTSSSTENVSVTFPNQQTYTGGAGETATSSIDVFIATAGGIGVPGASVHITTSDASGGPTAACQTQTGQQAGYVLSDSTGHAYCTLVFGTVLGTGATFQLVAGDTFSSSTLMYLDVTVGAPSAVTIVSGNQQTAPASGSNVSSPLVAMITDMGGNPISGATVSWSVVPSTAATTFAEHNTAGTDGKVSTNVKIASPTGSFSVIATVTGYPAVMGIFTVQAQAVSVTGLNKISGDGQSATAGTAFTNPLAVQSVTNSTATSGVTVAFAVTSGSATLSASSVTTNSQGQASVTVTAGATAGTVVVTATAGTNSQTFTLTVVAAAGPSLTSDSVLNGASFLANAAQTGGVSPCSIATLKATGLAPNVTGTVVPSLSFGPLPYLLASDRVTFGDKSAPIFSVINSSNQETVTVQVPCEISAGSVTLQVLVGSASKSITIQVKSASPGVFESSQSDGVTRAILIRPDGSFVDSTNPARRGETVIAYVTGMGSVATAVATNQVPIPGTDVLINGTAIVGVNNAGVEVKSVKLAANLLGVFEVRFVIPSDSVTGASVPFVVAVNPADGGATQYSQGSKIYVQ
jgi:adhesin/invasin